MRDESISDLDINREVRRVFVRHRINLGWLSVCSCRGNVIVHGELQPLPGTESELSSAAVGTIFQEIRRCRGVRRTTVELQNWIYDSNGDAWRPKTSVLARDSTTETRLSQVFEIRDTR